MTIKKLSPDKVRITLSHEELAAYEIDWDHLGPDDEPTRELLLQLLDSAWQTAGFRPDEGQIYIEALPTENGCVLILSKAHASDTLESICTPVIFRFEHAEDLLAGARQLFQLYSHRIFRSSLYQCAGGCLLLIRPLDQTSQESVMLLAEYGTLAARGELAAAVIQEHCPALIEENALERLCTPCLLYTSRCV